jgi:hypothetical protein
MAGDGHVQIYGEPGGESPGESPPGYPTKPRTALSEWRIRRRRKAW